MKTLEQLAREAELSGPPMFMECLARFHTACRAEALEEAAQWQPIETAPRDGTVIIVAAGENVWCDVRWVKRPRAGERWEHFWAGALRFRPTHWMPMPQPPAIRELK